MKSYTSPNALIVSVEPEQAVSKISLGMGDNTIWDEETESGDN